MKQLLTVFACLLWLFPAAAPAAVDPSGVWTGSLQTPSGDMAFVVNLHRDGDKWMAELDVPAQSVTELPLSNVKVDGGAVSFSMPGPGDPNFQGKLAADGKTLSGNFDAGGSSLPLEFKWKSEPRAVAKAPANTGDVQVLEGVWEGALDVQGNHLRLRFHFTKNADGSITGTLDSIDQGANGLPIGAIARTGDSIKLEVKTVGGSYEGTLNKDHTTITGNWSQGRGSLPLTLTLKQPEKKG
jgi:hypothetical protein